MNVSLSFSVSKCLSILPEDINLLCKTKYMLMGIYIIHVLLKVIECDRE